MPGNNEIECRGTFALGTACGDCDKCRRYRPYPDGLSWDEAWAQRKRADALEKKCRSLSAALSVIANYGVGSDRNDGVCPYGCDCPHIAQEALRK